MKNLSKDYNKTINCQKTANISKYVFVESHDKISKKKDNLKKRRKDHEKTTKNNELPENRQ